MRPRVGPLQISGATINHRMMTTSPCIPTKRRWICATSSSYRSCLSERLGENQDDPAVKVGLFECFLWYVRLTLSQGVLLQLKGHFLTRRLEQQYAGDDLDSSLRRIHSHLCFSIQMGPPWRTSYSQVLSRTNPNAAWPQQNFPSPG